jgi:hypothetical protein
VEGSAFSFDEINIVVRGAFSPILLGPEWLAERQLISDDDLSASSTELISATATAFTIETFRIQVTPDGLQVATSDIAESERARDLALGIVHGHAQTPLAAVGLNRTIHFTPDSEEEWHAVGDRLVPKNTWEEGGILEIPGMMNVTLQGVRPDKYGGYVRVQVQPSARLPYSVFIAVNDHFSLTRVENQPSKREAPAVDAVLESGSFSLEKNAVAVEVLTGEWSSFLERSEKAIRFVSKLGGGR